MRIIGTGTYDANRTTMTNSLAAALLTRPEIANNVVNLFEDNFTAFSSFLARRGMSKKGLYPGMSDDNYRVIGNRKVMWAVKGYPFRKGTITAATTPGSIGLNGAVFTVTLDTNYFSPNDNLELKDRRTIIQLMDAYPIETSTGNWTYQAKLATNSPTAYVPDALLAAGAEVGFSHTAFPELSETGYEKNTFPEWHTNFLTIQRMQYSISGSAQNTVLWVEHNGQKLWFKMQEMDMMRRWAYARENQLLWGRATIDANENVLLRDLKGREIIQGDGILAQGEGALKYQYNTLSVRVLENVMSNLQLLSNGDGVTEVLAVGGQAFVWNFQRLMRDVFKYNPEPLFVSKADAANGVKVNFNSYQMGGVSIVVAWNKGFDAQWRPSDTDSFGVSKNSQRAIFASLGSTIGGDPNIELLSLGNGDEDRRFVKKVIDGMASPSGTGRKEYASNSVDGYQVQVLSETGVCVKNPFGIAELYKP